MQFWLCLIDIHFFLLFETYRVTSTNISPGDLSTSRVLLILWLFKKCWENRRTHINSLRNWTPAFAHFEPTRWNLLCFFNICVPFLFQNKENWKCLLTSTNVSALCLDFDEVSAILQAHTYARCCPGQVERWNLIVARGMLKPVYFAFETMLEFFSKLHILLNHEHIRQDQRAE